MVSDELAWNSKVFIFADDEILIDDEASEFELFDKDKRYSQFMAERKIYNGE